MEKTIETARLILRPWREEDAPALYEYAQDPRVGPAAGWLVHTSVENSREIIRTVLSMENTFAVTVKALGNKAVGSVGVFPSEPPPSQGQPEIGYWIGVPFWGQGMIPEAVWALQHFVFQELGAERVWCAHFVGNLKSRRVIEKCGFRYRFTYDFELPQTGEVRHTRFYALERRDWQRG